MYIKIHFLLPSLFQLVLGFPVHPYVAEIELTFDNATMKMAVACLFTGNISRMIPGPAGVRGI